MLRRKYSGLLLVVLAGWLGLNHLIGGGGLTPVNPKPEIQAPKQPAASPLMHA